LVDSDKTNSKISSNNNSPLQEDCSGSPSNSSNPLVEAFSDNLNSSNNPLPVVFLDNLSSNNNPLPVVFSDNPNSNPPPVVYLDNHSSSNRLEVYSGSPNNNNNPRLEDSSDNPNSSSSNLNNLLVGYLVNPNSKINNNLARIFLEDPCSEITLTIRTTSSNSNSNLSKMRLGVLIPSNSSNHNSKAVGHLDLQCRIRYKLRLLCLQEPLDRIPERREVVGLAVGLVVEVLCSGTSRNNPSNSNS